MEGGESYVVFLKLFSWQTFEFDFSTVSKSIYRMITGISGSIFFLALFNKIYYKGNAIFKYLAGYRKYTLEIYILQAVVIRVVKTIIETVLIQVIDFPNINMWLYSLIITPVIAAFVFVFCIIIIKIIQKSRIGNLILFGIKIM